MSGSLDSKLFVVDCDWLTMMCFEKSILVSFVSCPKIHQFANTFGEEDCRILNAWLSIAKLSMIESDGTLKEVFVAQLSNCLPSFFNVCMKMETHLWGIRLLRRFQRPCCAWKFGGISEICIRLVSRIWCMSSTTGRSTETDICLQMIECGELLLQYDLKKFLPRSRSVNMYVYIHIYARLTHTHIHIPATYLQTWMPTDLHTYIFAHLQIYISAYHCGYLHVQWN